MKNINSFNSEEKLEINNHIYTYFDLKKVANQFEVDLLKVGVKKNNFHCSKICTFENKDCASYRRNKNNKNRMYSLIFKV